MVITPLNGMYLALYGKSLLEDDVMSLILTSLWLNFFLFFHFFFFGLQVLFYVLLISYHQFANQYYGQADVTVTHHRRRAARTVSERVPPEFPVSLCRFCAARPKFWSAYHRYDFKTLPPCSAPVFSRADRNMATGTPDASEFPISVAVVTS